MTNEKYEAVDGGPEEQQARKNELYRAVLIALALGSLALVGLVLSPIFDALVLAVLNLFNFPLGTILAVYTGISLLNSDAERLFMRRA